MEEQAVPVVPQRASLLLLGLAAFMVSADARVIDPMLHLIADNFGTKVGVASIVSSAYTIPYGLFQLVYGPMGDRIGKLRVMAGAMTLFAMGTAACAFVPNLPVFALLRFLTGVTAAAMIPLSLAYIGDKFPYAERQAALARFVNALILGQILSSSIGGIFGEHIGWRGIFILFGVIALIAAGGLWRTSGQLTEPRKEPTAGGTAMLTPYFQLLKKPATRLIVGSVFVEGFLLFGGFTYLGASLRDRYQLNYGTIGFMLSAFGLGGLIYSGFVKKLVTKFGEKGLVLLGGGLLCLGFIATALIPNRVAFVLFNMMLGLGFYTMHSTLQTRATELAPGARGTAVSLFAFCLFLGQGTGVAFQGRVVEHSGYAAAFLVSGIGLGLLATYLYGQMPRLAKSP